LEETVTERSGEAPAPAKRSSRILVLACGATFLALLDVTVVNLAIADLRDAYPDSSVTDLSWVITLYSVLFAAMLAPAGRISDAIGRRRLFAIGVGAFTLFSLACALAPNVPTLYVFRALQGAAAGVMIPASLAIILMDSPPERRASAIGSWSAAGALAAAIGPSVGGVLVDTFSWRSLFLINVPFGILMTIGARIVPADAGRGRIPDPIGTLLFGGGIGLAAFGVTEGGTWGWGSPRTLVVLAAAIVLVLLALGRSFRHQNPAIETELWRTRAFTAANIGALLYGGVLFAWMLTGVLFLTSVWGYSELKAGLAMSPGAVAASACAVYAGRLIARIGTGMVAAGALLLIVAAGLWATFALPTEPSFLTFWLPCGTLVSIGMGAVTTALSTAAALSVGPLRFAGATGLNQTSRQVGGALGIAAMTVLLRSGTTSADDFARSYAFCTILAGAATLVVAVTLIQWRGRPAPGASAAAATTTASSPSPSVASDPA
jgi:EmrB/QacA subfamily drug resistance transporter